MKYHVITSGYLCALCLAGCTGVIEGYGGSGSGSGTANSREGGGNSTLSGGDGDLPGDAPPPYDPAAPVLARLTRSQYANAITSLFGSWLPTYDLEPDTRPYVFSVTGAATTSVSEQGVNLYGQAGYAIAASVFADPARRDALVPCAATTPIAESCLTSFIRDFGLRAYRRPLDATELDAYAKLALAAGLDTTKGLQFVIATMLQSPNFLYRVELGEADAAHPGWLHYTGYEMATRLSFLLRSTIPDAGLLNSATSGELTSVEGIRAQAERLLHDIAPTREMVSAFFSEYLDLPKLADVAFPKEQNLSGTLAQSMQTEVLSLIDRVALDEAGDLRGLFTTRKTSVNAELAAYYGMPAVAAGSFTQADFPEAGPRAGLFGTAALLSLHNRPTRTAPTLRGAFVRRLLCDDIPPPPPNIPPIMENDSASTAVTIREKLAVHATSPACASCHSMMDPVGLGMEDFDQFGRYRTTDIDGRPMDSSGDLDGKAFHGARELGALLASDPRFTSCLSKQLYRYASARVETPAEQSVIEGIDRDFGGGGYALESLLLALVQSDGFRYLKPEAP